jgi:hypothetical protein
VSPEVVLYVPVAGHPALAGIAAGSAILAVPEPGSERVAIHFEGAVFGRVGMRTLADRAARACERLLARYPTSARRLVPREALILVGTFEPDSGRIVLAGARSERSVAGWIGADALDPAELRRSEGA